MLISPGDAILQTIVFTLFFAASILLTSKIQNYGSEFSPTLTNQLKGFAILTIILSHIGYFLSTDPRFLFPFSILAGVGVNLFLFLSGFGLTVSAIDRPMSTINFYRKRLLKIFLPLWVVLVFILAAGFLILNKTYPLPEVLHSFIGYFPYADLYKNVDSPLWYFSLVLFYYLIYPLTYVRKIKFLSPAIILLITYLVTENFSVAGPGVVGLYKLHLWAFPSGVSFALLIKSQNFKAGAEKLAVFLRNRKSLKLFLKITITMILIWLFGYTALHSGVGEGPGIEQPHSLVTTFSAIGIFWGLGLRSRVFQLFGEYSYEVYLFHWPLIYHFDFIYKFLPAFLATLLYLVVFLVIAELLRKLIRQIERSIPSSG